MPQEEAVRIWRKVFSQFAPATKLRKGFLGDGNGNVNVTNKPGWSWIRYEEDQNRLSQVRNVMVGTLVDGVPVMVGKRHHSSGYEEVLWVYWDAYSWNPDQGTIDQYATSPHGDTHLGKANDPAPIDLNNLAPGKVVPTDPASLSVTVQAFIYPDGLDVYEYPGADLDLTANVPAIAGHRYTLVYLDLATDSATALDGDIVAVGVDPDIPAPLQDTIPLAIVDLTNGDTTITDSIIYQYKIIYGSIGGDVFPHTHSDDESGGSSLIGIEELFTACWVDITLVAGVISPTDVYHRVLVPAALYISDNIVEADLHTIVPDPVYGCGQILILKGVGSVMYTDYRIRIRHGIGNIWLSSEDDVVLNRRDHITLIYDGEYWVNIATSDVYDRTPQFGNPPTSYSEFGSDGSMVMVGDATMWEDLRVPLERGKAVGAAQPSWANVTDGLYLWQFDDGDEIFFTVQMPHGWKLGTRIYPHLHWMPSSDVNPSDNVGIGLEYSWVSTDNDLPASDTITRDVPTGINNDLHSLLHNFDDAGIDGVGQTLSSCLVCRFFRQAAVADNYADPIWAIEIDFHYEIDTIGSRGIVTK